MSANNLRILYNNVVTQVNGSATSNSTNDYKSQYDSGTAFTITATSVTGNIALVAMLTEATSSVTMTVTGQTGVVESTSSTISSSKPSGYGGGKYIASYFTLGAGTTTFTVTFSSSVKVSKFLVGNYWKPKFNIGYGVQVGYEDGTSYERLQGGDLYPILAPRNKTLQFSLEYIDEIDKFTLFDIIKSIGKSKPLFVSLFPEDIDKQKEQMYSIYGVLDSPPGITYAMYTMYSSSFQLSEI